MAVNGNEFYREEMAAAERAAREAGSIIMGLFKGKFDVQEKSKNNPVTTADIEANQKIREIVRGRFPKDGWLSEEDKDSSHRLSLSRVWVIDPIDGSKEFIEGVPVVYNPAEDSFYKAAAGQGAFLNHQPIHTSPRSDIDGALLLVSRSEPQRKFQVFVDRCEIKPVGSIAFRLAKVAGGDGDGTLTFRSIHEWDVCGGVLLVEEAGGIVVDGSGKQLMFNRQEIRHRGVVAANTQLAQGLQGLWSKAMAEKV